MPRLMVMLISDTVSLGGTSSVQPDRAWALPASGTDEGTVIGEGGRDPNPASGEIAREATRRAVSELRRISGLTWEQLGELFGVSRRSVHFWASGQPLNAANEARLLHVLDIVRAGDRGSAAETRAALVAREGEKSVFDLLAAGQLDEARALLGNGPGRRRLVRHELSPEAKAARAPLRVEELIEARHEPVHRDPGGARAARTVRMIRRDTT